MSFLENLTFPMNCITFPLARGLLPYKHDAMWKQIWNIESISTFVLKLHVKCYVMKNSSRET